MDEAKEFLMEEYIRAQIPTNLTLTTAVESKQNDTTNE
jgi:hypothetical protein